jgi:uncharacterized protein (DUF2235 family)
VVPTNILKLSRAIKLESSDGIQQLMMYDDGIGAKGNVMNRFGGGLFGLGMDQKIMELYFFLVMNYQDGDEVYLFGFSRGAYTVRSLGGLISHSGLVRRDKIQFARKAYEMYRSRNDPDGTEARLFRSEHGERIPISLIACFDTVGDLGIPPGRVQFDMKMYQFHNTKLAASVKNGIHILSIDEIRKGTPMEYPTISHDVSLAWQPNFSQCLKGYTDLTRSTSAID